MTEMSCPRSCHVSTSSRIFEKYVNYNKSHALIVNMTTKLPLTINNFYHQREEVNSREERDLRRRCMYDCDSDSCGGAGGRDRARLHERQFPGNSHC